MVPTAVEEKVMARSGAVQDITESWMRWFGTEEGYRTFDQAAQTLIGISGEEFLYRWEAGEYDQDFDAPGHADLHYVMMLIPVEPQGIR